MGLNKPRLGNQDMAIKNTDLRDYELDFHHQLYNKTAGFMVILVMTIAEVVINISEHVINS